LCKALTKARGERLRWICHARGRTASELISEWIDVGLTIPSQRKKSKGIVGDIMETFFGEDP
jgi:DNA mismatch repair protein MutH